MRLILDRGTVVGGGLALVMCVAAWLAPAALASDSIYWSSYTSAGAIWSGDLGGSSARYLYNDESSPEGVAIDAAAGKIYWADTTAGTIRVANLDGTGAHDLYTGENTPAGVAIDPAAGLIYWADAVSGTGAIRVGKLDGSGVSTLFANESYPVGVAIDPADGKIYWGSYDTFEIRVGNLDGTGTPTNLFTGENYPTELAVDPTAGKLYWTNEFGGTVRVGSLDGATPAQNLYTAEGDIGGVAIDPTAGKIYWTNWNLGTVRVGSLDGTAPAQSLYTGEIDPWFVALLRAPVGTAAPQVTGGAAIGQTLTCTPGSWASDLLGAFLYRVPQSVSYQWTVGGVPVAGATANSVLVTSPGDYRCEEVATNAAGSTTQTSAATTVSGAPALTASPPSVGGSANAAFSGSVNPEGLPTTAHFEYGLDPSLRASPGALYDQTTPDQAVGSDFAGHALAASVAGLFPNALYHVRLVATNSAGVTFGPDQTFRTGAAAKPPPPVLGRTENAAPVSGTVFVLSGGRLVPLTGATQIRSGAEIDALHGTLSLTTATGKKKKTQTGQFGGAVFRVTQARAGPSPGADHAVPGRGRLQGRADVRHLQGAQGGRCRRHRRLEQDSPTPALERPWQVPHARALQRRHGPRHQVDGRRPLRRNTDPRPHRLGGGDRLPAPQDDRAARRAELSGPEVQVASDNAEPHDARPAGGARCSPVRRGGSQRRNPLRAGAGFIDLGLGQPQARLGLGIQAVSLSCEQSSCTSNYFIESYASSHFSRS